MVAMDKGFTHALEELLAAPAYAMGKPGADGIVYKVVLRAGREYAVRRLGDRPPASGPRPSDAEFGALASAVARARHPNVVPLRAFYSAPTHEKLLVYDFIGGGTLAAALVHGGHHQTRRSPAAAGERPLTWAQRLKIAKGVAAGLAFLHDYAGGPRRTRTTTKCVHGGVRSSRILLDAHMNAYISGFGLERLASLASASPSSSSSSAAAASSSLASASSARLAFVASSAASSSSFSSSSFSSSSSSRCPGANERWYRAPECGGGRPTQKCDVYAFGVVLIELLSGRPAAAAAQDPAASVHRSRSEAEAESEGDPKESRRLILAKILDPCLLPDAPPAHEQMARVSDLALACTAASPRLRPTMKSAALALRKLADR